MILLLSLLLAADPAPVPPTPPAPPPAKEKMVCRRQVEIGSLVRGRKVCMTESEHRRQIEEAQDSTARLQYSTSGSGPK